METRDPTARFSDRVEAYVRARPRYPPGVLRVLEEETGLQPTWDVADFDRYQAGGTVVMEYDTEIFTGRPA